MLALQGQDLPGVKWSVGLRHAGATEARVDAAFDAGDIVRSWPLRGTLHLVAAEDLRWLLDLTAPRAIAAAAGRRAALGLAADDLERARGVVEAALAGRRVLARDDLLAVIEAAGIPVGGQRGYHLLWHLALAGVLVLGPTDGRQQSFSLLEEWVPNARRRERDEALAELALRFFRSHGPATAADLARWSGLPLADVRRGIAAGAAGIASLELDGVAHHLAPEALDAGPSAAASAATSSATPSAARVHLLPGFDEYVLGYADRAAILAPEHHDAVVPGGNGMFRPTIVVDGEVVGTWAKSVRRGEILVAAEPFGRLPAGARDGLAAAVRCYGSFRGLPARLAEPDEG